MKFYNIFTNQIYPYISQSNDLILKLIPLYQDRSSTVLEIKEKIIQVFEKTYIFSNDQKKILDSFKNNKSFIIKEFSSIVDWNEYIIGEKINYIIDKLELKFKQLGQPLRLILSGCQGWTFNFKVNGNYWKELLF